MDNSVVYCRRCGRKLVDLKSREVGFGPKCFELWKMENLSEESNLFGGDIIVDTRRLRHNEKHEK